MKIKWMICLIIYNQWPDHTHFLNRDGAIVRKFKGLQFTDRESDRSKGINLLMIIYEWIKDAVRNTFTVNIKLN